jgi:pimeloyl-ACP methyl ester carboxylesterase
VTVELVRGLNDGMTFRPLDPSLAAAAAAESVKAPARVWRQTLEGLLTEPPPSRRTRIAARTLVLFGEEDPLLGQEQAQRLVRDIPGARLVLLPQTGHLPIWESPDRVAQELRAFL